MGIPGMLLSCLVLIGSGVTIVSGVENSTGTVETWSVRLIGGNYEFEGRVEVFLNDQWGTICDSLWGIEEATVVCKQLNYTGADLALVAGQYGHGEGSVMLDMVQCTGEEGDLSACQHTGIGATKCDHSRDAGVVCTAQGSLRLVNGTTPAEGRVEILSETGEWGTICDDGWSKSDARVACRQLGYPDAIEAITNDDYRSKEPMFGAGYGPILLDGLSCGGDAERHLRDCAVTKRWGTHDCVHAEDAGMRCDTKMIRLIIGNYSDMGRVEVYYGRTWGRICPHGWTIEDAHVACRELGFPMGAREAISTGGGEGPVLMDDVRCEGNETYIADCPSLGWANNQNCGANPIYSAGVICNDPQAIVRLLSGSSSMEGVVEYREGSDTGLICDHDWGNNDATVLCRQMGYQRGEVSKPVSLGHVPTTLFARDYQCTGEEQQLSDCTYASFPASQCDPIHIAQVSCGPPNDYDIRLAGSDYTEQGRVDVFLNGEWGLFLDGYTTGEDRRTICRQLGYADGHYFFASDSAFKKGTGNILIENLRCSSSEMMSKITDCRITLGNNSSPTYQEEVTVICYPFDSVDNHAVRLVNEKGEINNRYGIVQVSHDGHWGTICDYVFTGYQVVCAELGHTDLEYAFYVDSSKFPIKYRSGRTWFRFSYCPTYRYQIEKLIQCEHGPWGSRTCDPSGVVAVTCVGDMPFLNPEDGTDETSYSSDLVDWEIILIASAVVGPIFLIVCLAVKSHRSRLPTTSDEDTPSVTCRLATDTATINEASSPPPAYVPPSPPPLESPPTYESVSVTATQTSDPKTPGLVQVTQDSPTQNTDTPT